MGGVYTSGGSRTSFGTNGAQQDGASVRQLLDMGNRDLDATNADLVSSANEGG
jgi:hypothetical protein